MFTHGSASLQLFPVVWIFLRSPWVSFVTTDEFSVRVTKIASGIGVSWTHSLPFYFSLFKACVCYFSLFLKDKCVLCYFERSTLKRNITYSSFSFPLFHKHLFSPGLPRTTHLLEISCLEKVTVCVIKTMFVMLLLVQMNKARREVNQKKPSTNQDNYHERSSNVCYTLNPWDHIPLNIKSNEIFFEKYLLVKTVSSNN